MTSGWAKSLPPCRRNPQGAASNRDNLTDMSWAIFGPTCGHSRTIYTIWEKESWLEEMRKVGGSDLEEWHIPPRTQHRPRTDSTRQQHAHTTPVSSYWPRHEKCDIRCALYFRNSTVAKGRLRFAAAAAAFADTRRYWPLPLHWLTKPSSSSIKTWGLFTVNAAGCSHTDKHTTPTTARYAEKWNGGFGIGDCYVDTCM